MIGKVIKNNYKIMDEIGRGSVATVYLAKDTARNQVVALKIIHPERAAEGQFLQRFQREAKLLQMLTSPQAVKVFDYGEEDDLNFIVLEYVQGKTLAAIINEEGPLEVERALDLAKEIAECLTDTHAKGVVHRDLRPANVMVTAEGMVKVMDFGIAQGADLSQLSVSGVLGSPHYLSPEQAEGKEVDIRSDIYSLGVTLFEMLTGQRPYEGESAVDIVMKHLKEPVPSVRALKEDIPAEVDALVKKCMAKDPTHRYPMPPDLSRAIDDILRAMGAQAGPSIGIEAALTGQTLGQYRLLEQIGRGGMATVYKGYQPALERYVAIKVLPTYLAHEPDFAARFERAAKSIARLNHPHILPVYDSGREGELNYIAMRYVEAGTLKDMLEEPLEMERAVELIAQVGAALDYAHRHGVVHRDVKPANILMDEEGWPLLSDFGLARMMEASVQLTKTGVGVGTPAYMSPEQGQGLPVDERTDVYSLGVVLYEMLTGQVPFEAETPMAVVIKHITAPLPMPRQVNPEIPEPVEQVILKALAKSPNDRYATVRTMVEALKRAAARAEVREAAVPPVEEVAEVAVPVPKARPVVEAKPAEVVPAPRRRRGLCLGVLAGAVLILVIAVGAALLVGLAGSEGLQTAPERLLESLVAKVSPTEQARTFAEPILAAITEREPDYSDDFSDPASGWPVQSNARLETRYEEGGYSVLIKTANIGPGLFMDELYRFDDFVAQVDVRWVSSAWSGNAGFLWRFDRDGPCYGGWIDPRQMWGMWNRAKTMEVGGRSSHIHKGQELNRLTLVVRGEDIALYANDEPIAFASDDECLTGGVQLNVHAGEPGVHVLLDNFKVWDISDLAPADETPALTRAPSPADQARAFDAVVTAEALNVRTGPGADYDRIGVVRQDDGLDVVARTPAGDWLKVRAPDGTEGWVAAAYVALNIALDEVPEAAEIPPPSAPPGRIVSSDDRTGNHEIYVANSDGLDEQRLTDHPARDWDPAWSPDGTRIVFTSDRDAAHEDDYQLYVMDADGSNLTRLTYTERNARSPSWSPDGSRIAFHSWCGLAIINADGSNWVTLMEGDENLCVEFPTWSPDSHRIAFRNLKPPGGPPPLQHDIYVMNDDGSGFLKLATFTSEDYGEYVVWFPDGSQVLFDIWLNGQWRYYAVNSDGSGEPVEIEGIPDSWYPNFWPQWAEAPGEKPDVFTAAPTPTPIPAAIPPETPISPPSAGTGSATGRILWNDEPFAGVVVKLCTDWSMIGGCKEAEYTAVSGADGHYTIADLPPGTYEVATQIPGQENETGWMGVKAEVQSGETTQVKDLAVAKYDLQLLSPHEEETVKTATPALTWAGYPHTAYYKVYLSPWGGGETVVQFEKTAETTYIVASPLQPGKYHWSIYAYNARGTKLAESSSRFTVAQD